MIHRPDIVLLVLDTQRVDRLSCYGYPVETSPHLDVLATEATRFTHAVAPAQWTIPSHASMFTGLYPAQHTLLEIDSALPTTLPTLAERLQQGNYFTAAFSNNPFIGELNNGLQRGFSSFVSYGSLPRLLPPQTDTPTPGGQCFIPRPVKSLTHIRDTLMGLPAFKKLWYSQVIAPLWQAFFKIKGNSKGTSGQALSDAARLLIERRGLVPDQPVFCFINLMGTHAPFTPPHWAVERVAPQVRRSLATNIFLWRFNTDVFAWQGPLPEVLDPERKALLDHVYNAEVMAQDAQIGLFLHHLRTAGILDNTLLIVVADHGEHLGEKQLIGHAFGVYADLIHVPLLIRSPEGDLPRGATLTPFVSTRRLFHTALTAAGVATPAEESLTLAQVDSCDPDQGTAFVEAVPPQSLRHAIEYRRPGLLGALGYDQSHSAIYNGKYKLIAANEGHIELYAVRDDPHENMDLQHSLPEQVTALHYQLQEFRRQTQLAPPGAVQQIDDQIVQQRLRDLGYLS